MDLRDKLQTIATDNGWTFNHGRRDYQNIQDIVSRLKSQSEDLASGETFLMLDPIQRKTLTSNTFEYSGNFMVLTNSDLKKTYTEKYEAFIAPLLEVVGVSMRNKMNCDFDVKLWRTIEVVNMFDFNADGLSVSFNLIGYS